LCNTCRYETDIWYWAKKAWTAFANYIKDQAQNFQGYIECYTCCKLFPREQINAGHFKHRGNQRYRAIDFELKHIKPQCVYCNNGQAGMGYEFGKRLEQEYGEEWVKEIKYRRTAEPELTIEELKEIIHRYSA
jgi:hypothetical protein